MISTPRTLGTLVRKKNATLRRAIWAVGMPPRWSAQAPRARPPNPPVGRTALAPSSENPISALIRHRIERQKMLRNAIT